MEAFGGQSSADPRWPQGTEWPTPSTLPRRVGRKDGPLQDGRDLRAPVQFTGPPARQTGPGLLLSLTHRVESLPAPRTQTAPCVWFFDKTSQDRPCVLVSHACLSLLQYFKVL